MSCQVFALLGIIVVVILTIAFQAFALRRGPTETKSASPTSISKPELSSFQSVLNLKPFLLRSDVKETGLGDLEKAIQSIDGKTFDLTRGISITREVVSNVDPLPVQELEDGGMAGVGKGHNLGLVKTVGMGKRYRERTLQLKHHSRTQSMDSLSSLRSQLSVYQPRDMDSSIIIPVFSKGALYVDGKRDAPAIRLVTLQRQKRPSTFHEERPVAARTLRPQLRTHRRTHSNPDAVPAYSLPPGLSHARRSHVVMGRSSRIRSFPSGYRRSRLSSIEEKMYENDVVDSVRSREICEADEGAGEDVAEYIVSCLFCIHDLTLM